MQVTFEANTAKNLYAQIAEFLEAAVADSGPSAGTVAREAKRQIPDAEPEPQKPKRKRRTKAQIEADKKKAEGAKTQPAQSGADPFGDEFADKAQPGDVVTKDEARAALKEVHLNKGVKVTNMVLARYGVQRFIDVEEKHYPDLVKRCKEVAAGGEP